MSPVSWGQANSFSLPEIPNFVARHHVCSDCASPDWWVWLIATAELSLEVVSCPRVDMAPITMCSLARERKLGCQNMSESSWYWTNTKENMEKFTMMNKRSRWFHSSLEKLPWVRKSASWFLVSTYLMWILGSTLILSNNQSNSVGSGHVSHRRASSFDDHLYHSFVVFENAQLRLIVRRMFVGGYVIHIWQLLNFSISGLVFIDGKVSCPAQVSLG